MRTLKALLISILVFMLFLAGCSKITQNVSKANVPQNRPVEQMIEGNKILLLDKLKGIWIEEGYIENIKRFKSVKKSGDSTILTIEKDQSYQSYRFYFADFGQGGPAGYVDLSRFQKIDTNKFSIYFSNKTVIGAGMSIDPNILYTIKFENISSEKINRIILHGPAIHKNREIAFIKISEGDDMDSSIENYIENILFKGEYTDSAGGKYTFNNDGTAIWPDKTFKYNIIIFGSDPIALFDTLVIKSSDNTKDVYYYYEIKDNIYNFYKTEEDQKGRLTHQEKSFLTLRKIS